MKMHMELKNKQKAISQGATLATQALDEWRGWHFFSRWLTPSWKRTVWEIHLLLICRLSHPPCESSAGRWVTLAPGCGLLGSHNRGEDRQTLPSSRPQAAWSPPELMLRRLPLGHEAGSFFSLGPALCELGQTPLSCTHLQGLAASLPPLQHLTL